jgi:hypothetical protein
MTLSILIGSSCDDDDEAEEEEKSATENLRRQQREKKCFEGQRYVFVCRRFIVAKKIEPTIV